MEGAEIGVYVCVWEPGAWSYRTLAGVSGAECVCVYMEQVVMEFGEGAGWAVEGDEMGMCSMDQEG